MRAGWLVAFILVLYGASAFVVPTLAPVAINDDFLYARSVEVLREQGELRIFPESVSTLVVQIGWGAAWTAIFGESFGVLRASTVAFSLLAGWAMYGLCRELGVDRTRSALGTALVVFNPLAYATSFSFMSDSYLTGLVTVSVWCYLRGLRRDEPDARWTTLGSVAASMAFLVRHAGALVPLGVLTWLLVSRRLRLDRPGLALVARVALLPLVAVVGHTLWYRSSAGGTSEFSGAVADEIAAAVPGGIATLAHRLLAVEATYLGLFVLPIAVAAVPRLPGLLRRMPRSGVIAAALAFGALATTAVHFSPFQNLYPWTPQFLSDYGAGPLDLRGGRQPLVNQTGVRIILVLCALSAIVLVVVLAQRAPRLWERRGSPAGLVAGVLVWQAAGAVGPSIVLRDSVLSFDRYFLPLLPLGVALALWAVRDVRVVQPAAWAVAALLAVVAVASTRDHLVRQSATWELAAQARGDGIAVTQLDAGAAWNGTHAYGLDDPGPGATNAEEAAEAGAGEPGAVPAAASPGRGLGRRGASIDDPVLLAPYDVAPWWLDFYTPAIDAEFVVAGDELDGHEVLRRVEISSWLHREPTYLYLLRRPPTEPP